MDSFFCRHGDVVSMLMRFGRDLGLGQEQNSVGCAFWELKV